MVQTMLKTVEVPQLQFDCRQHRQVVRKQLFDRCSFQQFSGFFRRHAVTSERRWRGRPESDSQVTRHQSVSETVASSSQL